MTRRGASVWLFPDDVAHDWELRAACRGLDPTLFFGPSRTELKNERLARESAAKEVCAGCPVLVECREYAVAHAELFGVWGGLSEQERRTAVARRGNRTGRRRAG